jgi:hypothetical protein
MSRDKAKDPREKYRPPLFARLEDEDDGERPKRGRGRPTKITQKLIKAVALHILAGADFKDAALMAGICEKTYYNWRDKGLKGIASTNALERDELDIYIDFVQTCKEARANHIGLMHKLTTKAAEQHWQAADARLNRLERAQAMVRGRKEKRAAEKAAAKEAADGTNAVGGFKFYIPTKDGEPLDVVCSVCSEQFDQDRKCKCTKISPRRRLMAGEELPIELLKKLAEVEGVAFDEKDPQGTAERVRKAIGGE